jgi:aspartate aminotransferase
MVCSNTEESSLSCSSMLEKLQRSEVSNPPAYGAKIAHLVLTDETLQETWSEDLIHMSDRIRSMRQALYDGIIDQGK